MQDLHRDSETSGNRDRDRDRDRERNRERDRERDRERNGDRVRARSLDLDRGSIGSPAAAQEPFAAAGRADLRGSRCAVCGCADVRTDEVLEHGGWLLAECPRCDHRWTRALGPRAHRVRSRRTAAARAPADAA